MRERTLYIIIGVLLGIVVMQWQQGPQTAQAQAPEAITGYRVFTDGYVRHYVMLSNGDVYHRTQATDPWSETPPVYVGNFWGGAPVPVSNESWGSIKAKSK